MTVLVVEDAATIGILKAGLAQAGFSVDTAFDAQHADDFVVAHEYDAIVLEVRLPDASGLDLCRRWRARGVLSPVLFLTSYADVADRIKGFEAGGDDYVTKPFAPVEIVARVKALVRRRVPPGCELLEIGDVRIDVCRREVTRQGRTVPLTTREFQVLEYLARRAGRLVTRAELWQHVWAGEAGPDSNIVDVYIRYLRTKLGRTPEVIHTVRGSGYMIQPSVTVAA